MRTTLLSALFLAALVGVACSHPTTNNETSQQPLPQPAPQPSAANNKPAEDQGPATKPVPGESAAGRAARWNDMLLAIAAGYRKYTRMADAPHWAPTMCMAPARDAAFASKADEGTPHGRKLYFLWVKAADSYSKVGYAGRYSDAPSIVTQPEGQILVKESFKPADEAKDSTSRKLGAKADLFVMFKEAEGTEGTDAGWVYGTVSPDGKTVTSAGKLSTCMGCHSDCKHDRMFGMPGGGGKADTTRKVGD